MKKIIFAVFLFLTASRVFAPDHEALVILYSPSIEPYTRLIYAIGMVEGKCDTLAYNITEKAAGFFQIRPVRLEDYNMRTGSNYKTSDLFNYKISEKIFLYYAMKIGPYDFEQIARRWNGSGHKTVNYWKRIEQFL